MREGRKDLAGWPSSATDSETRSAASRSEPLLRPPDVARLLACSTKTVYAWAASGFLPSVRFGRLVRFRAGEVRQFVEAHAENPQRRGRQ
jgi:excisionase family DNA binding protein